jgi:putative membrane protein
MNIFLRWFVNAATLLIITKLIEGVVVSGWYAAFVAAAVLGLVNIFVKPLLFILTLPINILTLGLFTLVINAVLFKFAGSLVRGFDVQTFEAAFWGALVMSIVNILVHSIFKKENKQNL